MEAPDIEKVGLYLREWSRQTNLLSKIPEKAQKGFATLELSLTCIGVLSDFLAVGTNVGIIYWYDRRRDTLERLKIEVSTYKKQRISYTKIFKIDAKLQTLNLNEGV